MGVTVAIQITSPVEPDDRDLIAAMSMLLFALGQAQPATPDDETIEVPEPEPDEELAQAVPPPAPAICGKPYPDGRICFGPPLHRGRHLPRHAAPGMN